MRGKEGIREEKEEKRKKNEGKIEEKGEKRVKQRRGQGKQRG